MLGSLRTISHRPSVLLLNDPYSIFRIPIVRASGDAALGLLPDYAPATIVDEIIQLTEALDAEASLSCANSLRLFVYAANAGKTLNALFNSVCHCVLR